MIQEFCAENFTAIPKALREGVQRIELCDNLAVGGTTPSIGVMAESLAYTSEQGIPLMVMIRPRGGDYVYNDIELKIMERDILEAKKIGIDGIVVGCLTQEHLIDEDAMLDLLEQAQGLQVTFHMAFDEIPKDKQLAAVTWLAEQGVTRILTHGGPLDQPVETFYPALKELLAAADPRMTFIIGGGITAQNKNQVLSTLGCVELHGTKLINLTAKDTKY